MEDKNCLGEGLWGLYPSMWVLMYCYFIDVGVWGGHWQGNFSGHCLAQSLGAGHLKEPQHMRHFWWPEASSHQESLVASTWWKRGQKGCFVLDHWACLKFAAGLKCVGLPHHTWLHLLVMLSLRRAHPEHPISSGYCSAQNMVFIIRTQILRDLDFWPISVKAFIIFHGNWLHTSKIHAVYCYNLIGFACENRCEKTLK